MNATACGTVSKTIASQAHTFPLNQPHEPDRRTDARWEQPPMKPLVHRHRSHF